MKEMSEEEELQSRFSLGISYARQFHEEKALRCFEDLYKNNIVGFASSMKVFSRATKEFEESHWHYIMSLLFKAQGDEDAERIAFIRACDAGLAFDFYLTGNKDETRRIVDRSLDLKKDTMWSWTVLASLHQDESCWESSEQAFMRAIEIGPPSNLPIEEIKRLKVSNWLGLATVLMNQGKMAESEQARREAEKIMPEETPQPLFE